LDLSFRSFHCTTEGGWRQESDYLDFRQADGTKVIV
jgi:hypothetical protein